MYFDMISPGLLRASCIGKGSFLYSSVSSPLDRAKRFTLFALPGRHVHSDTNSASPGNILVMQQLRATTKYYLLHQQKVCK